MENLEWRDNLHKILKLSDKRWAMFLPQIVIDAIDSAYVAGLEVKPMVMKNGNPDGGNYKIEKPKTVEVPIEYLEALLRAKAEYEKATKHKKATYLAYILGYIDSAKSLIPDYTKSGMWED